MDPPNNRFKVTNYLGLFFVLVVTTIFWLPAVYRSLLPENFEARNYLMQAADWLVVLVIIGLIL